MMASVEQPSHPSELSRYCRVSLGSAGPGDKSGLVPQHQLPHSSTPTGLLGALASPVPQGWVGAQGTGLPRTQGLLVPAVPAEGAG